MKKHSYSLPYKDFIQAELITDFRVNKLPFYVEVNEWSPVKSGVIFVCESRKLRNSAVKSKYSWGVRELRKWDK